MSTPQQPKRRELRQRRETAAATEASAAEVPEPAPMAGPGGWSEPFVRCEDLVRIFVTDTVEVQALQGLSLSLEEGELVAVVGASGSGKSTLLSILSAQDRPTGGTVRVGGLDVAALHGRALVSYRRDLVGFVWQQTERNLMPYLDVAENVALPLVLAGRSRRAATTRVAELLDHLGLTDVADQRPGYLTGSQQQRTAIAVALANSPRLLLADEPTGELDDADSAEVLGAMEHVNRELGVTVVVVTHDPAVADHVDRTIQIRDGRTATEVVRRTWTDPSGRRHTSVDEYAVLDRVGRMQLPSEYLSALGLRDRVRLELAPDRVEVFRDERAPASPAVEHLPTDSRPAHHAGDGPEVGA